MDHDRRRNDLVDLELRVYVERVHIRCPSCGKQDRVADDYRWRPFCSRRCKMIDLGNWLDEIYKFSRPIGAHESEDEPSVATPLLVNAPRIDSRH